MPLLQDGVLEENMEETHYLVSCPPFLKLIQSHKDEMGILLFSYRTFSSNNLVCVNEVIFRKHLDGGGNQLRIED